MTVAPASAECYFTDINNVVRGRSCVASNASGFNVITTVLPEMVSMSDISKLYNLIVTYMANGGAGDYTGMTLPTLAATQAMSMPGIVTALFSVYDASFSLKGQAKL
jgi:hypothetical protein